jgi:hypothetical protein
MEKPQKLNTIAYQHLLEINADLLELKEWHEALHFMNQFLDSGSKKNPNEIRACAELFDVVYQNFDTLLVDAGKRLNALVELK